MAQVWTTPKTWELDDVADASTLNQQLRDNMEYIARRPTNYVKVIYSANENIYPVAVGSFQHLPDFDMTLTTETGRVLYQANLPIADTAVAGYFDVYIPELGIYLSTDNSTPATFGLSRGYSVSGSYDIPQTILAPTEIPAGTYTFQLMVYSNAVNLYLHANTAVIAMVREF